jgi:tetratricopeptide (TPR) repeat protein
MLKRSFAFLLVFLFAASGLGQQSKDEKAVTARKDAVGFIDPSEINLRIEYDVRTFVVMAAVGAAGFDYETGGQPISPARAELKRDQAGLDPALRQKLAAYYQSHRRAAVEESADATRYAALSLLMTQPPAFSIFQRDENAIPPDLRPLLDFVPLVQEFYVKSGIKNLFPKYNAVANVYVQAYRRPVGEVIYKTLEYFKTQPQLVINMRPLVVTSDQAQPSKKDKPKVITRTRTRQLFLITDPLSAMDTAIVRDDILNQKDELLSRRMGDDYIVVVGPSRAPTTNAARQAMIRYVIDPMVERHLRKSLEYKDQITKLVASVPTAASQFRPSVYLVLRESLAQAAEARMKRIDAAEGGAGYSEDDAVFDLAQSYLRGAALAFHFYEALTGLEKVGINIEDFFDQMVETTKFEREAERPKQFEAVVARVSAARRAAASKAHSAREATETAGNPIAKKIILSDDLIRQRRYGEARPILEEILVSEPRNARALYGLAQVVSQTPSRAEQDPKADDNDKIQGQYERFKKAVDLYRKAIENASRESEGWLIQWSHVYIGRMLDFQEFRADAVVEYEKAIALGEIPNGAYQEALEGKRRPFGNK